MKVSLSSPGIKWIPDDGKSTTAGNFNGFQNLIIRLTAQQRRPVGEFSGRYGLTAVEMLVVVALFSFLFLFFMEIFSGKLATFRKTSESYRLQSGLRLLIAHLSMDVRAAVGFREIKDGALELYVFRNIPAPSRDWTDNLLDGNTKTTMKIKYELAGNTMTRSVDGQVREKYEHILLFEPRGIDLAWKGQASGNERFRPVIVESPAEATGIFVHMKARVEVKDKIEEVEFFSRFMSISRHTLRIYGMGPGERPFFPDRGGYFSPVDRVRTF